MKTQNTDSAEHRATGQNAVGAGSNGEGTALALTGAALLALGLTRTAMRGDVAMGSWLMAVLPAIAGAATAGNYWRRREAQVQFGRYLLGAYAALVIVVCAGALLAKAERRSTANDFGGPSSFTPANLRDVATRGEAAAARLKAQAERVQMTDSLAAEDLRQRAGDFTSKVFNSRLLADNVEQADTFEAVIISSLLGLISDPYSGQRENIATSAIGKSTFTPEEQRADLGRSSAIPARRGTDSMLDIVAAMIGSGIGGAAFAAMLVAGIKARSSVRTARGPT